MKKMTFSLVLLLGILNSCTMVQADPNKDKSDRIKKNKVAKKIFLESHIASSKKEHAVSLALAKKLITEHADSPHIMIYLKRYLKEWNPKGLHFSHDPKVKQLKAQKDKAVVDLVVLAHVTDYGINTEYLKLVIKNFPESVWAEWAESYLGFIKIKSRFKGLRGDKQFRLEYCDYMKSVVQKHPNSQLMPCYLEQLAVGLWDSGNRDDNEAKQSSAIVYKRILDEYPEAEFYCAEARLKLRKIYGESYQYPDGNSEEDDRIIVNASLYDASDDHKRKKNIEAYMKLEKSSL